MLRAGIIGCGGIANTHGRVLSELANRVTIAAVCDIERDRAEGFGTKYAGGKAAVYTDFTRMFAETGLDVVYVCLPPFAQSNEVELAAERGIHVFMEKPIALTTDLAHRIVNAVEKHQIKSHVGFTGVELGHHLSSHCGTWAVLLPVRHPGRMESQDRRMGGARVGGQ